jgi:hypothetical protein
MNYQREPGNFRIIIPAVVFSLLLMLVPVGGMASVSEASPLDPGKPVPFIDEMNESVQARIYTLPLSFIPNAGQMEPGVAFTVTGHQSTLEFTPDAVVIIAWEGSEDQPVARVIRHTFPGSSPTPVIEGKNPLSGAANYFIGSDPSRWQTNVPTFGSIERRDWPVPSVNADVVPRFRQQRSE